MLQNKKRDYVSCDFEVFNFLDRIVKIDSQSKNSKGVEAVLLEVKNNLIKHGFNPVYLPNPVLDSAPLLVANLNSKARTVVIICHADTVIPAHLSPIRREGDYLIGAGIADNKAGIAIALKGIFEFLKLSPEPNFNIQVVCSPYEELGSTGFHQFFSDLGKNADLVLGFEPAHGDGNIISSRNGNKWYKLNVKGKAQHSGRAHKSHINAAHDLFNIVSYLDKELRLHNEVTMNVGEVSGGHSFNTICDSAFAKIDTRFKCFKGLSIIKDLFEKDLTYLLRRCHIDDLTSKIEIEVHDYCPPLEFNKVYSKHINSYIDAIRSYEDFNVQHVHSGGAADINHFWHEDQKGFDGLGAVGGRFHRVDEFVYIPSINTRSRGFTKFLECYNVSGKELH